MDLIKATKCKFVQNVFFIYRQFYVPVVDLNYSFPGPRVKYTLLHSTTTAL